MDYHVKVTHRYSGGYESLIASAGFDSPGLRNGKIIFYDPDSGKVYAEQPFSKLKATETATAELSAKDRMFIKNGITKVAVRVLDENETTEKLTEMRPHYMVNTLEKQFEMPDREAFEPSAIIPETKENTTDPSESTSGRNIYKTVMIGAAAVLLVVSMTVVLFKRKKKNKEV